MKRIVTAYHIYKVSINKLHRTLHFEYSFVADNDIEAKKVFDHWLLNNSIYGKHYIYTVEYYCANGTYVSDKKMV